MTDERLRSWRPGPTRDAILGFLDAAVADVPVADRVAYLDNDGTLWCEKPNYVQLDFFLDALGRRVADDPSLRDRPEFAAVLSGDAAAIADVGLARVAVALAGLFDGQTPDEFAAATAAFLAGYRHPTRQAPVAGIVYQPMLELLDALRAAQFTIGVVTGGGTEFVRQVSQDLYGVGPELVVGTLIGYDFGRDADDRPELTRTVQRLGDANEGAPKVAHFQSQI